MDTNLSDLLSEICREYGIDSSLALPSIKVLNDNFFFRIRDIKNMNFTMWMSLNLPINLFFIIQSKVALLEGNQGSQNINPFSQGGMTTNMNSSSMNSNLNSSNNFQQQQNSQIYQNQTYPQNIPKTNTIDINTNIDRQYPIQSTNRSDIRNSNPPLTPSILNTNNFTSQSSQNKEMNQLNLNPMPELNQDDVLRNDIYQVLDNLVAEINDREKAYENLKKIHTIIMNIVQNPTEQKYKKLKLDSNFFNNYIKPYKNASKFLELLNFALTTDGQFQEYVADGKFILKASDVMTDFLIERKFAQLNFNPYQTSITSISGFNPKKVKTESTDFEELLKQEYQRREDIIKNSNKVERKTKVFDLKKNKENKGELMESLTQEDKVDEKKHEEDDFYKYAMNLIKNNSDKFVIKRKTEFEKLVKKPIYSKATIRIQFPNELLLQANFAMMETVGDIYEFVKENLLEPNSKFVLFTSFPSKKYTDLKATIHSQGLAPSTLLYVSFPDIDPLKNPDYPYISLEAFEKYITEFKLNK